MRSVGPNGSHRKLLTQELTSWWMSGKIKEIPEMWPRSKESISFILRQFEGLDKWLLDQVMFFSKYSIITTLENSHGGSSFRLTLRFHCSWPAVSHSDLFLLSRPMICPRTSLCTLRVFSMIGNYIFEHIYRLSYSFDVFFIVCWS